MVVRNISNEVSYQELLARISRYCVYGLENVKWFARICMTDCCSFAFGGTEPSKVSCIIGE